MCKIKKKIQRENVNFASVGLYFFFEVIHNILKQALDLLLACRCRRIYILVVLLSESGHHHGQELLEGSLNLWGESGTQFSSNNNGQAVRKQLHGERKKGMRKCRVCIKKKKKKGGF